MSVPLDQLYHFIESIVKEAYDNQVVIYRFSPHGSKDIRDLSMLNKHPDKNFYSWLNLSAEIFCNDQEPLNYELYNNICSEQLGAKESWTRLLKEKNLNFPSFNLRGCIKNIWDNALLLHSEQRSYQIDLYKNCQFIPVYYWSHALIALDWFRYAQHVKQKKEVNKTFLIYNRAWAGTREYRLQFAELLIRLGLEDCCQTSVNPIEPELGIHYELHKFSNPVWRPTRVLENFFPTSTAHSHYSANFDIEDYEATDIEVVLETLFDDHRLHLTEKTLRPIACAQPFILAGTHGSLEYLRSYGFKTFRNIWDERYDLIEDPYKRLVAIADLMKRISTWLPHVRERKMDQARAIAEYNRQHFFSDKFSKLITNELKQNLKSALEELESTNTATLWFERRKLNYSDPDLFSRLISLRSQDEADYVFEQAKKYYLRTGRPLPEK
jgi:hypothetical protein